MQQGFLDTAAEAAAVEDCTRTSAIQEVHCIHQVGMYPERPACGGTRGETAFSARSTAMPRIRSSATSTPSSGELTSLMQSKHTPWTYRGSESVWRGCSARWQRNSYSSTTVKVSKIRLQPVAKYYRVAPIPKKVDS